MLWNNYYNMSCNFKDRVLSKKITRSLISCTASHYNKDVVATYTAQSVRPICFSTMIVPHLKRPTGLNIKFLFGFIFIIFHVKRNSINEFFVIVFFSLLNRLKCYSITFIWWFNLIPFAQHSCAFFPWLYNMMNSKKSNSIYQK